MLKHFLYCPQFCLSELQIVVPLKNAIKARKFSSDAERLKVRESSVLQERHIILADSIPFKSQCSFDLLIKTRLKEQETGPWLGSGEQLFHSQQTVTLLSLSPCPNLTQVLVTPVLNHHPLVLILATKPIRN